MDSEKDLLKQDLNNQEKPEEIKKFIEDAELLGHEDIAELGKKKLQEILDKAGNIEKTNESQSSQIKDMGGSENEINNRTQEIDQEIDQVKSEATSKINQIKNKISETVQSEKFNQVVDAVPVVGGAKRVTEGVVGKTLSGEELSGKDRLEHGVKGTVDLGLDLTGVGEVKDGAKMAYVGEKIASGVINESMSKDKNLEQELPKQEEVKTKTPEEIKKGYENKSDNLYTEKIKLDAQLDYLLLKNDIPGFTKLLVQKFEKEIESRKLDIEQLKERELIEKQKDPSFDRSYNIRENETKIKDYEKRIETAKEDVTRLYEYNVRVDGRGSSANENISGLSPSQLAGKYNTEIRHLMEENEKYSPSGEHDSFPHKFDKLNGLIDIAKEKGDIDLLNYIKQYGVKLPEEIKNKLNS